MQMHNLAEEFHNAVCECGKEWVSHNWDDGTTRGYANNGCAGYVRASKTKEHVITNAAGGKQHDVDYAFHAMPPDALLAVAAVLKRGLEAYGLNNWKKIPIEEHLNHSVGHSFKHLAGDTTEFHLANAACRALFALQLYLDQDVAAS
jgi:hypothetical protein